MPVFTRDPPQQLGTALPNNVPQLSNPMAPLLQTGLGVANAYAQQRVVGAKAAEDADTASRLLNTSVLLDSVRTQTLSGGDYSPEVASVIASQSSVDIAASQLSGRVSDVVKIRQSIATKQAYQQALASGNVTAATKILELGSKITGTAPGMATQDVIERQEIKQEKIQEKVREITVQKLNEYGQGALIPMLDSTDPKAQKTVSDTLANIDNMIVHQKNTAAQLQQLDLQAKQLSLSNTQQEALNKKQLLPNAEKFLGTAHDLVSMAIAESVSRPLLGADPELISAQKARINAQFDGVVNSLVQMRRPGIEANVDAIVTQVKQMHQHALDAADNKDAANAYKAVYDATKQSTYLKMPDEVRQGLEYLPLSSAIQAAAATGKVDDGALNRSLDYLERMSTLLTGGPAAPSIAAAGVSPQDQKEMFTILNNVVTTNLDKLGLPENEKTVKGVVAYLVGASNDYKDLELKQRVQYGDFVTGVLSSRAFDTLVNVPGFKDPRNLQHLNYAVSAYKADMERGISSELGITKSIELPGVPYQASPKLKVQDLVLMSPTKDGVVFSAKPVDAKTYKEATPYVEIEAQRAAQALNAKYGSRYKQVVLAERNLGIDVPPVKEEAAPAPKPEPAKEVAPAVSSEDQKLLDLFKGLSQEERDYLIQAITPAQ